MNKIIVISKTAKKQPAEARYIEWAKISQNHTVILILSGAAFEENETETIAWAEAVKEFPILERISDEPSRGRLSLNIHKNQWE